MLRNAGNCNGDHFHTKFINISTTRVQEADRREPLLSIREKVDRGTINVRSRLIT